MPIGSETSRRIVDSSIAQVPEQRDPHGRHRGLYLGAGPELAPAAPCPHLRHGVAAPGHPQPAARHHHAQRQPAVLTPGLRGEIFAKNI